MSRRAFTDRVVETIRSIPQGMVASYGMVAALSGNARAARQVARILHSCSRTEGLPWHRVVNREGRISLPPMKGGDEQRTLLEDEGVVFGPSGCIDLEVFGWLPGESA